MSTSLDFPRVTATVLSENLIRLEISGQAPSTHDGDTPQEALNSALVTVARVAAQLGRPVRVTGIAGDDTTKLLVHPDGTVENQGTTTDTPKTPLHRRPWMLVVALMLALALVAAMIGAVYFLNHKETAPPPATPTAVSVPDTVRTEAADPTLSSDGKTLAYFTDDALVIADAETGQRKDATDMPAAQQKDAGLRANGQDGFMLTTGTGYRGWSPDGFKSAGTRNHARQFVTRGGTTVMVSKKDAAKPSEVHQLDANHTRWKRPVDGASWLSLTPDAAYWATAQDGGTIVGADAKGKETSRHKLAVPEKGAKLAQWAGVTHEKHVVTVWTAGKKTLLVTQDARSDEVAHRVELTGPDARTIIDQGGHLALRGQQVIDLDTQAVTTLDAPADESTPLPRGFKSKATPATYIDATGIHVGHDGAQSVGVTAEGSTVTIKEHHITITPEGAK